MQVLMIRASAVALACVGLLLLAGCDGGTTPTQPPVISIVPAGVASMEVGDTLRVRTVVQNTSRTEVTYTSSNPTVASVAGDGLVKALSAGETSITAALVADPSVTASMQVRVREVTGSVIIQGLINNLGQPVDPTRVQGIIFAQLQVERGTASRLEVLVDTMVACQRTFATAAVSRFGEISLAAAPLQCDINTAAFDSLTGTPRFFNGPAQISARLVSADDRVLFRHGGPQVVLNNSSFLLTDVSAPRQANDASGLRWLDGDLSTSVIPVLYDRGAALARAEFTYRTPGGARAVAADTVAPFAGVFREDSELRGVFDPALVVSVTTATRAGAVGPTTTTLPVRYDNERPTPGRLVGREWVGAQYEFARSYLPKGEADRGVGRVHARIFALRGSGLLADTVVARGKQVARGSDLDQAPLGTYQLAALVCDALDNCVGVPGFSFGVDNTAPSLALPAGFPSRIINPGRDLALDPRDDFSGFDARPIEAIAMLLDADPATPACGPELEGENLPGRVTATGACVADTVASVIFVPRTTPGYYTYTVTPFDRAGNRGETVTLTYLVDRQPPAVSFSLPSQLVPGEDFTASAEARDNLDLTQIGFRLVYPAEDRARSIAIPFDSAVTVGRAFDGTLTTTAAASRRFPFVRTLTYATGTLPRVTVLVDSLQVVATDAAQQRTSRSTFIPRSSFGDSTVVDPFPAITGALTTRVARTEVCTASCSGAAMVLPLSAIVTVSGGAGSAPFATLRFYAVDANGVVRLLGPSSGVSIDATGNQRTYTYSLDYVPPAGLEGSFRVFAVGVNTPGNALASDVAGPSVRFYTNP